MKSPLWLSRIRHGFILQGTDNNRLYSGNHVTIISKISPHTGDWWAALEKLKFFFSHSKSCLLNPYHLRLSHVIIYLCYILFSHGSTPHNTQRDQTPPQYRVKVILERSALQMPGASADVWKSRIYPSVPHTGYQINRCCSPTGGLVEKPTQVQLSLAAAARSTPARRTPRG